MVWGLLSYTSMEATKTFVEMLAEDCDIEEYRSEDLCAYVFESVAKSLGYSASVHFVMQLPYEFQVDLFKSSQLPDRSITAQKILNDVADIMGVPPEGARRYLQELWSLLNRFADPTQLRKTLEQLPPDVFDLFVRPEPPVRHDFQQWLSIC
jgi:uncharacterized protein (DUF2267 family)